MIRVQVKDKKKKFFLYIKKMFEPPQLKTENKLKKH